MAGKTELTHKPSCKMSKVVDELVEILSDIPSFWESGRRLDLDKAVRVWGALKEDLR